MNTRYLYKYIIITLVALVAPMVATAQNIVSVNVDTIACLGDTVPVSIGFRPQREIVVQNGIATLGSNDMAFLPDGVVCNGSCSYEAPVFFTDFDSTATITSTNDILYVRINMEHSFIGDIYIGLKCPNGQRASLMNWAGTGTSPCTDSVPMSHRGWDRSYANTGGGTFLGLAYDHTGSPICDSTAPNNEPGIGWNYCWSDDTTHGFQYANDDGLIYRASNATYIDATHKSVDSSNVRAGTNFFHPDQDFGNLIGCPLNGRWTIEVIDAYSQDNGYIFEWAMAFDPLLLPSQNSINGQIVEGSQVITYNDSTFAVTVPEGTTTDTVLQYQVHIFTALGDTLDTAFNVHYYAPTHFEAADTICQGDTAWWRGQAFTADTLVDINTVTVRGCDSIIHLNLKVKPTYSIDSTNGFCRGTAVWHHMTPITDSCHLHEELTTVDGCDSIVDLTFNVYPVYHRRDTINVCTGDTAWRHGYPITADTAIHLDTVSVNGCDSIVDLVYHFMPSYLATYTVDLCKGDTIYWNGMAIYATSHIRTDSVTMEGCDSSKVTTYLFHPTYQTADTLRFCQYEPFVYEGHDYGGPGAYDTTLTTVWGCDSLVHALLLTKDSAFAPGFVISDDNLTWSGDTAFHGCLPVQIYLLDTTRNEQLRQIFPGDSTAIYTDSLAFHTYDTAGVFTVSLRTVSLDGCYDTLLTIPDAVLVYPNPVAAFDWDNHVMVIHDAATNFINLSRPDTIGYLWEITRADGSTDTSTAFEPHYEWASANNIVDEGDYNVTLTAIWTNVYDDTLTVLCTDTVTHTISIVNDFLKFPNLVTPNGDGTNDTWRVINLLECGIYNINELWIFNQWGEQVYHVENIYREEDFWDPAKTATPNGTYYYRFAARSKYGVVKRNGTIEVLYGE